jgi:hypothetical protein
MLFYFFDRMRTLLSKPFITFSAYTFSLGLVIFSIYKWVTNTADLGDLAPEFLSVFVISLLTLRKRRQ